MSNQNNTKCHNTYKDQVANAHDAEGSEGILNTPQSVPVYKDQIRDIFHVINNERQQQQIHDEAEAQRISPILNKVASHAMDERVTSEDFLHPPQEGLNYKDQVRDIINHGRQQHVQVDASNSTEISSLPIAAEVVESRGENNVRNLDENTIESQHRNQPIFTAEIVEHSKNYQWKLAVILAIFAAVIVAIITPIVSKKNDNKNGSQSEATSPRVPDAVANLTVPFSSTEELYEAVQAYLVALSTDSPETSPVSMKYGYPIGTWQVSALTNFSRVFDSRRTIDIIIFDEETGEFIIPEPYIPDPAIQSFNEDISAWDVSNARTMREMFAGAISFQGDISGWDVSKVTDFSFMFTDSLFDQDLSTWDVSSSTTMQGMFLNSRFNHDISEWDVSNVTNMREMFSFDPFNQDISRWDVSKVTNMDRMFANSAFSGKISTWDVSQVISMAYMFADTIFNNDISKWVVGSVTDMQYMFFNSWFNRDISQWDVSKVISMEGMFAYSVFNKNISTWDVSNVENMVNMFSDSEFNRDISDWTVNNVTNMYGMFANSMFNEDISHLNVSKVIIMDKMFAGSLFNQDISSWDVSNVQNMSMMFYESKLFNQDISKWNVSNVIDISSMFQYSLVFVQNLCEWGQVLTSGVDVRDMFAFTDCPDTSDPNVPNGPFCFQCQ